MNQIDNRAAGTICAAGCVAAAAGLIEGILLACVYDPFGAGWASRSLSLLAFLSAYFSAGCILGALVAVPLSHAWSARADRFAPAAACGLVGAVYADAWVQGLGGASKLGRPAALASGAAAVFLFAAAGSLMPRWLGRARGGITFGLFVAASVCALLMGSPWTPARASTPAPLPSPIVASPAAASPAASRISGSAPPRNLLIIVADTLRADHLSSYGYQRATSPELERYSRNGVTFTSAIVPKPKTSPSVASLFTGTYPHTHGILTCRTPLPESAVTLAEILRGRDFATHAIVANSNVGGAFQFDQGFDSVDEIWAEPASADARGVTDHALDWLQNRSGSRPFFLYVHYIDPHAPYAAPAPWTDRFVNDALYGRLAHLQVPEGDHEVGSIRPSARLEQHATDVDYYVARYDAEVAYLDHHLGRLFDGLSRLGLDRDTLVVFTADHGEALSEHEVFFAHGGFAYDDTVRVPLVIVSPGRVPAGGLIARTVETVALAPTALQALDIPPPPSMESAGFWSLAVTGEGVGEAPAFIEADISPGSLRVAIRNDRWKLIENPEGFDRSPGRFVLSTVLNMNQKEKALRLMVTGREFLSRHELYDLTGDPGEKVNLAASRPDVVQALLPRLAAWRAAGASMPRLAPVRSRDLPEDVLRNLESLGYVR